MKFWILCPTNSLFILALIFFWQVSNAGSPVSNYLFIENKGQWPSDILFRADIPGGQLYVKKDGLRYFFYNTQQLHDLHTSPKKMGQGRQSRSQIETSLVTLQIKNANVSQVIKSGETGANYNFFYGKDQDGWVTGAKAYTEVQLHDIYPGIDFRLYGLGDILKYEYLVHPGADASLIRMKYTGLEKLTLENGQLLLTTRVNQFKEFKPYTYQGDTRSRKTVGSSFQLINDEISFQLENYDHSKDLVIDPELVFSTYSGSVSDNWSHTATYDSEGNLYAGGTVFGASFPVSPSAFQQESGWTNETFGSVTDVVIMKYSTDGKSLLYATFLGGLSSEVPHSLICNSEDDLVIMGTTSSSDFPVTSDAFQQEFNGGRSMFGEPITSGIDFENGSDLFVCVIDKNGTRLKGSTFVGGKENDGIHDYRAFLIQNYGDEFRGEVYVDSLDNIYVASITTSDDFPTYKASSAKISSAYDGVVFELNKNASRMLWGTFLGGNRYDGAYGIRVNDTGEVYVVGSTLSDDLRTTSGAYQRKNQGEADGFIARFKDQKLIGLTYIGTSKEDLGHLIDLDGEGNVYIFGLSQGKYPVNGAVYQNPGSGQFIHALSPDLSKTMFSTVFGSGNGVGTVDLVPTAFLVNECGNIYIAGWGGKVNYRNGYNEFSTTLGLPVTRDAYRKETTGNNYYLAIFEAKAKSLLYATFFGSDAPSDDPDLERGDHLDGGTCRFDKNGIIYHSACVCRANNGFVKFPTTNGFQKNHNSSNCNMAAFKFDIGGINANFDMLNGSELNPEEVCAGTKIRFGNKSVGGITYEWSIDNQVFSRREHPDFIFNQPGEYEIKLESFNVVTCALSDSFTRIIKVVPFESGVSSDTTVCSGAEVLIRAFGGDSYQWTPEELTGESSDQSIQVKVEETTTFTVEIQTEKCNVVKDVTVTVDESKEDFMVIEETESCSGRGVLLEALGSAEYFVWSGPNLKDTVARSILVNVNETTVYKVQGFYSDGCQPSKSAKVVIDNSFAPEFSYRFEYDCGEPYQLIFDNTSKTDVNYIWYMGNGDSLSVPAPEAYRYIDAGEYEVKLVAENDIGCRLEYTQILEIPEEDGLIPNAISPNNDGKNDTFVVGYSKAQLKVFNRWGKEIFSMSNYDNSWGTGVDPGTYFYELKLPDGKDCKGWIEVFQ